MGKKDVIFQLGVYQNALKTGELNILKFMILHHKPPISKLMLGFRS